MLAVSKKKSTNGQQPKPSQEQPPDSILIRLPDPRLAAVLEEYAQLTRRSRNLAIVVLLEDAMKEAGLWPPGESN